MRGRSNDPKVFRIKDSYISMGTRTLGQKIYVFERPISGDSRVDQVLCSADWFWKGQA